MNVHPINPLITDEWCWVTDAAEINRDTILRRITATDIEHIVRRCQNCGGGA